MKNIGLILIISDGTWMWSGVQPWAMLFIFMTICEQETHMLLCLTPQRQMKTTRGLSCP